MKRGKSGLQEDAFPDEFWSKGIFAALSGCSLTWYMTGTGWNWVDCGGTAKLLLMKNNWRVSEMAIDHTQQHCQVIFLRPLLHLLLSGLLYMLLLQP